MECDDAAGAWARMPLVVLAAAALCHASMFALLPALPPQWSSGSVQGLRARGGYEVDISWRNGKLTEAVVRSINGGSTGLRYGSATRDVRLDKGETQRWDGQ